MCAFPACCMRRVVHPKTLGSKLISVGPLDKTRFPNTQVVVKGNLVGVVAPTEWEAIKAAQQVASGTKWTDWKGLPGDQRLFQFLKEDADWKTAPAATSKKSKGDVASAIASSPKKLSATYQLPFFKHAPIGPTMAVADVRPDGTVYVYTHTQNPQALRTGIAHMLNTSVDKVVVRTFRGTRSLWPIEWRQRRGRGRSRHSVAGSGQARSRAVDAPRRFPVVHAIVRSLFGRQNRS